MGNTYLTSNEGIMSFMLPGQVFSMVVNNTDEEVNKSGLGDLHPS